MHKIYTKKEKKKKEREKTLIHMDFHFLLIIKNERIISLNFNKMKSPKQIFVCSLTDSAM